MVVEILIGFSVVIILVITLILFYRSYKIQEEIKSQIRRNYYYELNKRYAIPEPERKKIEKKTIAPTETAQQNELRIIDMIFRNILSDINQQIYTVVEGNVNNSNAFRLFEELQGGLLQGNDTQNVHDSNVSDEIKYKILVLVDNYKDIKTWDDVLLEIDNEVDCLSKNVDFENKINDIDRVLEFIITNNATIFLGDIGNREHKNIINPDGTMAEKIILKIIWERINSDVNKGANSLLIESFFEQVYQCIEKGEIVCTTGRISRLIDTLTLLDENEMLSKPISTINTFKIEIFNKCGQSIKNFLDKKEKTNPELVDDYNKGINNPETNQLQKKIEEIIIAIVNEYEIQYKDKKKIIEECIKSI
jgi:hypothetical protein